MHTELEIGDGYKYDRMYGEEISIFLRQNVTPEEENCEK
jgi:hypothetical protein